MRGKALSRISCACCSWITPAYAGKSHFLEYKQNTNKDHPRLCGEKGVFQTSHDRAVGSPPPMRGKGNTGNIYAWQFGITPAYAGKRKYWKLGTPIEEDHPRLCGEK